MSEWKRYRKKGVTEVILWEEGMNMDGVSVSDVDRKNGSPKLGDVIARNPTDRRDRWLVAKEYFKSNYIAAEEKEVKEAKSVYIVGLWNGGRFVVDCVFADCEKAIEYSKLQRNEKYDWIVYEALIGGC